MAANYTHSAGLTDFKRALNVELRIGLWINLLLVWGFWYWLGWETWCCYSKTSWMQWHQDNGASPSRNKLVMAKEMADNSIAANATSDSEGENDFFYHLLHGFHESTYRFYCTEHILFELAIQISVWTRIIRKDGKIRNIPLQNLIRAECLQTWLDVCFQVADLIAPPAESAAAQTTPFPSLHAVEVNYLRVHIYQPCLTQFSIYL